MPDPLLFTDRKDPSIDQWLSKMQSKFEINWNHYLFEKNKFIYIKNRVKSKALQYLEPIHLTILKIYLATLIERKMLWRNFEN